MAPTQETLWSPGGDTHAASSRAALLGRSLFEGANDALLIVVGDRIIDCNPMAEEMFLLSAQEIRGRTPIDLSPRFQSDGNDSATRARAILAEANRGVPQRFEWLHERGDGSCFDAEVAISAIDVGDEKLIVGIVRDVTERNRHQDALRESEECFRRIFNQQFVFMGLLSPDGRILEVNDLPLRVTGRLREEYVGSFLWEAPAWEGLEERQKHIKACVFEAATMDRPLLSEGYYQAADGSIRYVDASYTAIRGDDGEVRHILAQATDTTERKLAAQKLVESESRFRHLAQSANLIPWEADPATWTFKYVGEQAEQILGYPTEEWFKPGFWVDHIHPEDRQRIIDQSAASIETRDNYDVEYRLLDSRGRSVWLRDIVHVVRDDEGPCLLRGFAIDVTNQKQAEEALRKSEEQLRVAHDDLRRERDYLREEVEVGLNNGEIVGKSPAIGLLGAQIEAVSGTTANVLIQGESGVGKELVARAIHAGGARASKPLVKVNCASIPRELFESEFFGHVRGAFTGAHRDRVGRFQLAHGGTLFLDEVSEIPMELQPKLLRVLQEGEFERVGEDKTRRVDVRVIAATNRDLKQEIEAGRFRGDLFYRLGVFPLGVPPLRERREDIMPLAIHFLERARRNFLRPDLRITRAQAAILENYDWPGNVRELQNIIERATILSRGSRLRLDLALSIEDRPRDRSNTGPSGSVPERSFVCDEDMRQRERQNLVAALEHAGWRISGDGGAAELLGLKPSTLTYRMRAFGITKPGLAPSPPSGASH